MYEIDYRYLTRVGACTLTFSALVAVLVYLGFDLLLGMHLLGMHLV